MAPEARSASQPTGPRFRRLRTDVLLMLSNKASVMVLNIAGTVITARELGVNDRGIVAVGLAFSLVLVQVGSIGLASANPYFAVRDPSRLGRIVANSVWLAAFVGLLLIGVGAGVKALFPSVLEGLGWVELLIVLVGVPAGLATLFLQSILLGEARTGAYNAYEVVLGTCSVAALAVGFYVFDMGVIGALVILSSGSVAGALTYFVLLLRHRPPLSNPDTALIREMLKYGFRIYAATLMGFLVVRVDLLLVNGYLGNGEAGIYSVAAALATAMFVIPAVIGLNLFPRVAQGAGVEASAQVFRCVALLYGALCLITVPFAEITIRLAFGDQYASAATLYYWLVPGIFSFGMLSLLSQHFAGRGFPLEAMLVWIPGLALNVVLNVIFLPGHGTYVAALTSSIAYALILYLHMRMFAREAGGYGALVPNFGETARFVKVALGREAI